jgi:trimeric autotransporter adhesin
MLMKSRVIAFLGCCVAVGGLSARAQDDPLKDMVLLRVEQKVQHVVYDSTHDLLYASVPANYTGPNANSLVTIDPASGQVVDSVFVGENPNRLAISSDNSRVYIGIDGEAAFRWWEPATGDLGPLRPLITNSFNNPATVENMAVQPGKPDVVVVAKDSTTTTTRGDLEVFDDHSSHIPDSIYLREANSIAFASATTLVSANNQNTGRELQRFHLAGTELTLEHFDQGSGFNTEIETSRDGRIYATSLRVFDVESLDQIGILLPSIPMANSVSLVQPIAELGLAYVLGPDPPLNGDEVRLHVFDTATFTELTWAALPGVRMDVRRGADLIIAGSNRLAFTNKASEFSNSPQDLYIISGVPVVVPEPAAVALLIGVAALAVCGRR